MRLGIGIGLGFASAVPAATAVQRAVDLSLLLAAVVEPLAKTVDGSRIALIMPAWKAILGLLAQDPEALHKIGARKMEELIAAKYDAEGFDEVILTPRSRDFGRDVIATKDGKRVKIFDQVKAFGKGKLVGANDVRALMGTWAFSDATKGVVTTTSDFAPLLRQDPIIKNALDDGLELVNGQELLRLFEQLKVK